MPNIIGRTRERVAEAISSAKIDLLRQEMAEQRQETARLRESLQFNDPQESSWVRLGQSLSGETGVIDITKARANSRYYWRRDPAYGRAVRLTRNYVMGRGIVVRAKDDEVQRVVRAFWDDPDNKLYTRAQGQWELCDKILVDGELFPTFFVNAVSNGAVKASLVEPEEIYAIIPHPDNRRKIRYYYRWWLRQGWDFKNFNWSGGKWIKDYYPDWGARASFPDDGGPREMLTVEDDPDGVEHATVTVKGDQDSAHTDVYMTQVRSNQYGLRALPSFYSGIVWASTYKGFMEDRATITLAAATFAFKQKIKGGAAAVARMVAQLGAATLGRYGGTRGRERSEGAQTMVENEAADFQQLNVDTKAANARDDGRMLRQQLSAATDVSEPNLFGDPSVGNLASLTAMDGPQLKGFESWQQLFADLYADMLDFVIRQAIKYGTLSPTVKEKNEETGEIVVVPRDLTVEVDFPPVVGRDLGALITAISTLISAQSLAGIEYVSPKRLAAFILTAFGETDIETALAEIDFEGGRAVLPGLDIAEPEALPDELADQVREVLESLALAMGNGKVRV